MTNEVLLDLQQAVIDGNAKACNSLTKRAIDSGFAPGDILQEGLIPGIKEIGSLFGAGEAYLPELIVSGRAMEAALVHLEPLFRQAENDPRGKFLIGTVQGDVHDIGKNIVVMMLKGAGWEVTDLGVDVAPEALCTAAADIGPDVIGLSALLTTTMGAVETAINALKDAALLDKAKIMIGGAPVTQDFADKVGADAYGRDGWDAVVKAEKLMGSQQKGKS